MEKHLDELRSQTILVANPSYNLLIKTICKNKSHYINKYIIPELDNILRQKDSVKLFYAHLLESEGLGDETDKLLDSVQDTSRDLYLNCRANRLASNHFKIDEAIIMYKKAVDANPRPKEKAKYYNNMASVINRHKRIDRYQEAIEYCDRSIWIYPRKKFFYPLALRIALEIDLLEPNVDVVKFTDKRVKELEIFGTAIDYMIDRIICSEKSKVVSKFFDKKKG